MMLAGSLIQKSTKSRMVLRPSSLFARAKSPSFSFNHKNLPDETLYILDGTSMLYKSYYARDVQKYEDCLFTPNISTIISQMLKLEPEQNECGTKPLPCGGLISMAMNFISFIRDVNPRYLAVAFDTGKKTFRHDQYAEYKGNRDPVRPKRRCFSHEYPKRATGYYLYFVSAASTRTSSFVSCSPNFDEDSRVCLFPAGTPSFCSLTLMYD